MLTRHAIAYQGVPPTREWVQARRDLLTGVTAASLKHQTRQAFEWLVFVDTSLADEEVDYLKEQVGTALNWRVVAVSPEEVRDGGTCWRRALGELSSGDRLMTTRLDSDDAMHPGFIETVASVAADVAAPMSVDLVRGAFIDSRVGIPLSRPYRASPFQSLVEIVSASSTVQTVMAHPHPDLPRHFPYLPVNTPDPMWFVSVHGGNIGNRAFGRPRSETVVPSYLHAAMGVRRSTPLERWRYGLTVAKGYSARFGTPASAAPAARRLAGHLTALRQSRRDSESPREGRS